METGTLLILSAGAFAGGVIAARTITRQRRLRLIEAYAFPASLPAKLRRRYPELDDAQVERVLAGLREYFTLCAQAGRRVVAMPSQAVDAAWHEFILFTRGYQQFCERAFGRFLHHTPAEAMPSPTRATEGIKRAWRLACAREGIDRERPNRLPLLFALDAALGISDGFVYELDCRHPGATGYCASHIGCSGGCAGGGDDGGGCGGGCGGD